MARKPRIDIANNYYHCINRANARVKIYLTDQDYLLFLKTLKQAQTKIKITILSFVTIRRWQLDVFKITSDVCLQAVLLGESGVFGIMPQ
jgi:hypothetical protein